MSDTAWQKSSFSGDRDECVELGRHRGKVVVRESAEPSVVISVGAVHVRALIGGLKEGCFD
ncbi:DUF397 domain-containing protein [Streptomyces sp. NPDC001262]|uniref:DUF397 domain-containing protein n=1 Tax=Streptomyces TaxID=1883 RepID=UPI00369C182B